MGETFSFRIWVMRGVFVAICAVIFAAKLAPSGSGVGQWPGPDLMTVVILAWTIRRPEFVPPLLVGLVVLISDLIFLRPPGLWAATVVLACEVLRSRTNDLRNLPFSVEWATIAIVLFLSVLLNRAVYALFLIEQMPLLNAVIEGALSILAYPIVVFLSYLIFDIRKAAPGEVDSLGRVR